MISRLLPDLATTTSARMPARLFWLAWLGIAAVYVALRINLLDVPLTRDEGLFAYVGQRIIAGDLPYRDVYDHKPPILFLVYALNLSVLPATAIGIHLFAQLWQALSLLVLYQLARRWTGSTATGLWAALAFAVLGASAAVEGCGATAELYTLLPLLLSLLTATLAARRHWTWLLLSGACGAAACWIKQPVVTAVFYAWLLAMAGAGGIGGRQRTIRALLWLAGGLGLSLVVVAFFVGHGVTGEFIYWSFTHSLRYSGGGTTLWKLQTLVEGFGRLVRGDLPLLTVGVVTAVWRCRRDRLSVALLAFLGLSTVGILPGHHYAHYYQQLTPALALLAGVGLAWLPQQLRPPARRPAAAALAVLLLAASVLAQRSYYLQPDEVAISRYLYNIQPFPEALRLAAYVREHAQPDDTVLVFGSEPEILVYAQRRSATGFVTLYPLLRAFPRHQEFQRLAWQQIQANRPTVLIFFRQRSTTLWDRQADLWIADRVRELAAAEFELDGAMLNTGGPQREFYRPPDTWRLIETNQLERCDILVLRRRH